LVTAENLLRCAADLNETV